MPMKTSLAQTCVDERLLAVCKLANCYAMHHAAKMYYCGSTLRQWKMTGCLRTEWANTQLLAQLCATAAREALYVSAGVLACNAR